MMGTLRHVIFYFISFLILPKNKIKKNSLLLIRLDAIGDYILFRNFIEILKKSEKYKNYEITLLGNSAWKDISLELDSDFVDKFIWLDRGKFVKSLLYKYQKLKEILLLEYSVVLNPIYSRELYIGDHIVKLVNAKEKIGSIGDLSNIKKFQKDISNKFYTKLIGASNKSMFEFHRNREFFENLLDEKIDIVRPFINLSHKKIDFDLPEKYSVLFIGASTRFRKWSITNFVAVGRYLRDEYNHHIVLCGGPSDLDDAHEFKKLADYPYFDLVGKTSLVDFMHVISNGNLMIANETSAPHFAVALKMTNIFVIFNGYHFGRFTPYPKEIWNGYHPIYHPDIEKNLDDYKKLSNGHNYGRKLDINDISFEKLKSSIQNFYKGKV